MTRQRPSRPLGPEALVLKQIRDGLRALQVPHRRIGVGKFRVGTERRFVQMGEAGLPDLIALPRGMGAVFIEVKSATGKLTDEQRLFRDACRAAGVVHVVARSLDDVLPWVRPGTPYKSVRSPSPQQESEP